jgi:hypothetical protein
MLSMQLRVEIPDFVNDSSQESGFDVDLFLPGSSTTKTTNRVVIMIKTASLRENERERERESRSRM